MLIKNIHLGILDLIKLDAQNELLGHSGKRGVDVSRKKKENPDRLSPGGVHKLWRCPTLAQPRDALPLGLQRFTSVFGMGTGGATAL